MKKSKRKLIVIVMALIAIMTISGTAAYFTSTDQATNTWTVGKVKIDLQEVDYEKYRETESRSITPNCELHKDPKASNTGSNSAFVFMRVKVPKAAITIQNQEGVPASEATVQELFDYKWNSGWTEVESREIEAEDGKLYQEHVVVYGTAQECTALEPGKTTPVLFMNALGSHINNPGRTGLITLKNFTETPDLENLKLEMDVEAFAIQTENLTTADTNSPKLVWDIINAQTGA